MEKKQTDSGTAREQQQQDPRVEEEAVYQTQRRRLTCVAGADVAPHVALLHADVVTDAAAQREHPLLPVHMERHVADKLGVEFCLEATHMAAGRTPDQRESERETTEREALERR